MTYEGATETETSDLSSLFYLKIRVKSHAEGDKVEEEATSKQMEEMLAFILSAL